MKLTLRALGSVGILAVCLSAIVPAQGQTIPAEYAPIQIGKGLAKDFSNRSVQGKNVVIYPEICAWYGSLIYAREAHDKQLLEALQKRFEDLLAFNNQARVPNTRHVDFDVFGVVPLELYMQTGEKRYLEMGLRFADLQWESPQADGLSSETRYWIDDMYMLTILQLEAYRATKNPKYLLRGAKEMAAYIQKLQQPNGLFFHSPDAKYFWGRGNGWVAAGMTEMLTSLPKSNPNYPVILAGYKKMMSALLASQGKDGVWRQLLDKEESWAESSSSGMFTFAFAEGVRNGWLAKDLYSPAVYRAWTGVSGLVDQNSLVTSVCEGTNKEDSLTYYLLRKRRTGDLHGQAAVLWAATAMARLESSDKVVAAK
ncbi:glycoside hydrolase family 88/105 protein [Terriglobus tenax]|uniref:glycoside hydrolase family 88/105 protein n=1 Tax=Terriglobus tenax TaxID=1111115 RepID=UPI0021E0ABE5|nr:glycoside hydrolase family 88 protein [Terriglobus tenax]